MCGFGCVSVLGDECYLNCSTWDPDPIRLLSPAQVLCECDLFSNMEMQTKMRERALRSSGGMERAGSEHVE